MDLYQHNGDVYIKAKIERRTVYIKVIPTGLVEKTKNGLIYEYVVFIPSTAVTKCKPYESQAIKGKRKETFLTANDICKMPKLSVKPAA